MSISVEEVRKIASLARLKLTPEEEVKYTEQLSAVLNFVDQLKTLKTSEMSAELEVVHSISELRSDESDGGRLQGEILELAPSTLRKDHREGSFLSVPAVFGEE